MKAKKILLSLFSLFFLFLSISLVNAQEDFTASTKSSIGLCPCSNQAYVVTVQNTGTAASSYTVLASGNAAEWVSFSPNKFVLNPGQKGNFFVSVNSECNVKGDYGLDVFITTQSGLTKVIKQTLKFSQCYDYSLEQGEVVDVSERVSFLPHGSSYLLCKDEQKAIPILITNKENFGNRYILAFDGPEFASLNIDKVQLDGNKAGILLINFDTTDVEGEFDFNLNAISELGKVQRKKSIGINVEDCYALNLELEKRKDVVFCGGENKSYEISLKNPVALEQNVELELQGPDWASVDEVSFDMEADEEKTAALNLNPEEDVSGIFLITVSAIVENKIEFKSSDMLEIKVFSKSECRKADINAKESVTNLYSKDLFFVSVKNIGIKKATYDVALEGVSWVSVSPETLKLNPGQSGNLNLILDPDADVEQGTYNVKINLESDDEIYSKDIEIVLRKENEVVKKIKETARFYQYYLYLIAVIVVLIFIFRKRIIKVKKNAKKRYEKYKVKKERLRASRLAREEKEDQKKKEEEDRKEKKEEQKEPVKKRKIKKRLIKPSLIKKLVYIILFIAAVIFVGHINRWFNAKYLHIYLWNIFVGYFYYISIGVGVVIALFLMLLFYNYVHNEEKKKGKVKAVKKAEKKAKKPKLHKTLYLRIFIVALILFLAYAVNNLDVSNAVKDFFVLYQYYIILGVAILIAAILLMRFYKPLFKFLKE